MKFVYLLTVLYFICISFGYAHHNVSLFHPWILPSCIKKCSWTIWFNSGKPYNSSSGDFEDTIAIIANNPETVCRAPIGIEVQTINYENGHWNYEWQTIHTADNITLFSFHSTEPAGVDFRVRYCCSNNILTSSTPETTTESSTCGVQAIILQTNENTSESIYDIEAVANSWPWMIYVNKSKACSKETCSTGCGAILIDKDHLITSAHCIDMIDPMNISLIAGAHRLSSTSEKNQRQLRSIKQIFLHPEYNSSINVNDIAVLRLETSFIFTKYVQPICLSNVKSQFNEKVIVVGWGGKQFNGVNYKALKQVYTTVINDCKSYWSFYDNNFQLCVPNMFNKSSMCQDHEYGAIFTQQNGHYVLEGISSYMKECNTIDEGYKPSIYTRISTFHTWINQIVQ